MPETRFIDVIPARQDRVVALNTNQTVGEAMRKLGESGILSAPVVLADDEAASATTPDDMPGSQLVGWIDINDIVNAYVKSVEAKIAGKRSMLLMMAELEADAEAFAQVKLSSMNDSEDRRLIYKGDRNLPLKEAVRKFFLPTAHGPGVHRVAIFNDAGTIEQVISQMDVVRHVYSSALGSDWMSMSVKDAGLMEQKELTAVDISTPTLRALQLLVRHGRSTVAVLSKEGKLITNLSISDLRRLQPSQFGVLALPVGEFLGMLHGAVYIGANAIDGDMQPAGSSQPSESAGQFFAKRDGETARQVPLVRLPADTTVQQVMEAMVRNQVHRVYIVDDATSDLPTPLAIISASDIVTLVAEHLDS